MNFNQARQRGEPSQGGILLGLHLEGGEGWRDHGEEDEGHCTLLSEESSHKEVGVFNNNRSIIGANTNGPPALTTAAVAEVVLTSK